MIYGNTPPFVPQPPSKPKLPKPRERRDGKPF